MTEKANLTKIFTTIGASNHSLGIREEHDYYATEPLATQMLLEVEEFRDVLEPACGEGHISDVLKSYGITVLSSDLIDRNYGIVKDFFERDFWNGDIITNPPYKKALEFVRHAIEIIPNGRKVAMFLKIQFLEGQARRKFFDEYPPARIYVFSKRVSCAKNGKFDDYPRSAICYAWFVWEKGVKTKPVIEWIN